jgi:hypothetical protein
LVTLEKGKGHRYELASHSPDYLVAADVLVLAFIIGAFSGYKTLVERGKLIVTCAHCLPDRQVDGLLEDPHTPWSKLGMIERPAGLRQGWCPSTVRFQLRWPVEIGDCTDKSNDRGSCHRANAGDGRQDTPFTRVSNELRNLGIQGFDVLLELGHFSNELTLFKGQPPHPGVVARANTGRGELLQFEEFRRGGIRAAACCLQGTDARCSECGRDHSETRVYETSPCDGSDITVTIVSTALLPA